MLTAEEAHKIACEAADNARSLKFVEMIVEEKIKAAAEKGSFSITLSVDFIVAATERDLSYISEYLIKKLGYKVNTDIHSRLSLLSISW